MTYQQFACPGIIDYLCGLLGCGMVVFFGQLGIVAGKDGFVINTS